MWDTPAAHPNGRDQNWVVELDAHDLGTQIGRTGTGQAPRHQCPSSKSRQVVVVSRPSARAAVEIAPRVNTQCRFRLRLPGLGVEREPGQSTVEQPVLDGLALVEPGSAFGRPATFARLMHVSAAASMERPLLVVEAFLRKGTVVHVLIDTRIVSYSCARTTCKKPVPDTLNTINFRSQIRYEYRIRFDSFKERLVRDAHRLKTPA